MDVSHLIINQINPVNVLYCNQYLHYFQRINSQIFECSLRIDSHALLAGCFFNQMFQCFFHGRKLAIHVFSFATPITNITCP